MVRNEASKSVLPLNLPSVGLCFESPPMFTLQICSRIPTQVYRITQGFPVGEYLLIENRQPAGFDNTGFTGGILVFHIDDKLVRAVQWRTSNECLVAA